MSYINKNNFMKAVRFIYDRLDEAISLEDIAYATGLSISSLKRLFLEATAQSVGSFVRRLRMERAFRSLKDRDDSILEIALSAGFTDHSAFARAFKENFGYSPSCAREKINLVDELDCVFLQEPEIVQNGQIHIQTVSTQGLYFEAAPLAWKVLKDHLTSAELDDDFAGTFIGIGHDNPHDDKIAEDKVRFSAGITHVGPKSGLKEHCIEAGIYAKFLYTGKLNNLGLAYHYIYGAWKAKSTFKINPEMAAYMVLDRFPDDLSEYDLAIYVPLLATES